MNTELNDLNIMIFGLGLMGGSIALSVRNKCNQLIAIDPDPNTQDLAQKLNIVDEIFPELPLKNIKADLIILAAPIHTNIHLLEKLTDNYPNPAIILDISSTKQVICEAMQRLPERFEPIGGHPICGKEKMSLKYADATLYAGNIFALTPLQRTALFAKQVVLDFVRSLQSIPFWIDAATHDRWVANTSHLPYILSNVLAESTPEEVHPLVGPGFRSTSRLAESNIKMMLDIISSNKDNILAALDKYQISLDQVRTAIQNDDIQKLREFFQLGSVKRKHLNDPFEIE